MAKRKPKAIHIEGRRWFRRSYGNTYSSVCIYIDGGMVQKLGPTGGYGEYYSQIAVDWLFKNGHLPGIETRKREGDDQETTNEHLRVYGERVGIIITDTVADVARERDL